MSKGKMPGGFSTMPTRVAGERSDRLSAAANGLSYHNTFLDDRLRMILPHDLVIITARTGAGKTSLALDLGIASALSERSVGYFALEAEPKELERRIKYKWMVNETFRRKVDRRDHLNFADWLVGNCEDIVGHLDNECNEWFLKHLSTFWSYYKGVGRFDSEKMNEEVMDISRLVELIIIDHLHYVDSKDGDNDNKSLSRIAHTLRDCALGIGKPVVAVAHLRKRQGPERTILPEKDDLMGSSDLPKIATQIVALAPARFINPPKWWMAPTLIGVIKDRRTGEDDLAALVMFDKRSRSYSDVYTLGRLTKGCTEWDQLKPGDVPSWAKGHRPFEPDAVAT